MVTLFIILGILAFLALAVLIISYICFRMAFYVTEEQKHPNREFDVPDGEIYEPHHEKMKAWMREIRALPHEDFYITAYDGLRLHGRYYESKKGAPIEILMHGYRGNAERDLCGGVQRCFMLGRNTLIIDQRGSGESDGNVISFGIKERYDCKSWVEFLVSHFGDDVKIITSGISMGAATVLMAQELDLPKNVVGVLADCGYNSPRKIIEKTIREMKLPPKLAYPFVKLGAKVYGKFDLEETTPEKALAKCRVPVIFFHGDTDDFVPHYMSEKNFAACASPRRLVTVHGAGHGLSYIIAPELYLKEISEFFTENGVLTVVADK